MFFDWPLKPKNQSHTIYSTLGEYRGGAADIVEIGTVLHSASDLKVRGNRVKVYSPSTGLVRRYSPGASGNPSAGSGPIRVGHFGFNHIIDVLPEPGRPIGIKPWMVYVPNADLPIYIEEPEANWYRPKHGIANPTKDAHFDVSPLSPRLPKVGYRKVGPNNYLAVTFWPRSMPIGNGVGPTDLHCIYYETDDGPFADPNNVRNTLEVFRNYRNTERPEILDLRVYPQNGAQKPVSLRRRGSFRHEPSTGGVKLKLFAHSPFSDTQCCLYSIDYEICAEEIEWPEEEEGEEEVEGEENEDGVIAPCTGILNAWTFHQLPVPDKCYLLVDESLSDFSAVNKKHTVFILTNSREDRPVRLSDEHHWEIEDPSLWPDGRYVITVWVRNIRESRGAGARPVLNEVAAQTEVELSSRPNGRRKLKIKRPLRPL